MGHAYTEGDALDKWCPEARVARVIENVVVVVNKHPQNRDPYEGAHCVGSGCMHWVWLDGSGRGGEKKGYCGLSGIP